MRCVKPSGAPLAAQPACCTPLFLADEGIVQASGKMEVLDRLLRKLKRRGHRVVLFSQVGWW